MPETTERDTTVVTEDHAATPGSVRGNMKDHVVVSANHRDTVLYLLQICLPSTCVVARKAKQIHTCVRTTRYDLRLEFSALGRNA